MADVEIKRKPVYTAQSIKSQLYSGDRTYTGESTWQSAETFVRNIAGLQTEAYRKQYRDAVNAAYDSYEKNRMAIRASDLLGSSQTELINQQRNTLTEAYNTYQSNLYQAESSIQQNLNTQLQEYDKLLTERAENMEAYFNSYGDYYEYLRETYGDKLINNALWKSKFGEQVFNEDGTPQIVKDDEENEQEVWRLKSYAELQNTMFNEDRTLNEIGIDFYDILENSLIQPTMYEDLGITDLPSYEDYLYSTNKDLYDWYSNVDIYNWSPEGKVANTMKLMTGRASNDYEYSFLERMGGLTETQIDKLFEPIQNVLKEYSEMSDENKKNKGKQISDDVIKTAGEALNKLAKDLGIDKDFEKSFGVNLETLTNEMYQLYSGTKTAGEMTKDWFTIYSSNALAFTVYGGVLATFIPGVGTGIGAGVGAVVGVIAGVVIASMNVNDQRNKNRDVTNEIIQSYQAAVNSMVAYSKQKQQESNQNFVAGLV